MPLPRLIAGMFLVGLLVSGAGVVCGQTFPSKPLRIVTSEAGGGSDFAARLMAPRLAEFLGHPVIIDNRGAAVSGELVAKAPPDGHTLILAGPILWLSPFLRDDVPYDPVRDFSPVALTHTSPNILVVHPSLPVRSVNELIALAKSKPGALNYSSGLKGTPQHLTGELFKAMAKVDIEVITYRGAGPAINALIGGEVQIMFPTPGSVAQHVKSGRLRALAVTSAKPSELLPGLPTVAASVPGYESITIGAILAPANTPATIINRLSQEFARVLGRPDVKEQFLKTGVEPVGGSPEQLAATLKSEMAKWGNLIRNTPGMRE